MTAPRSFRSRNARPLAVVTIVAFLSVCGCYLPPFDEKVSESEHFAAGLDHVARLGPVYMNNWSYSGGFYLPTRESASTSDGYWVRRSGTELLVSYMSGSSIYPGNHTTANALADGFVAFPLSETQVSSISTSTPPRGLLAIFGSDATSCMPILATDASYGLNNH